MRTAHSWFCLGVTKGQTPLYRPGFLGRQVARCRGRNIFIGLVAKQTSTFFFAGLNADNCHQLIFSSTGKKKKGVDFYWPRALVCSQPFQRCVAPPTPLPHTPTPGPLRQSSSSGGAAAESPLPPDKPWRNLNPRSGFLWGSLSSPVSQTRISSVTVLAFS